MLGLTWSLASVAPGMATAQAAHPACGAVRNPTGYLAEFEKYF